MDTLYIKLAELTKYILSACDNVSNISSWVCSHNLYAFLLICCFDRDNKQKYVKYAIPYEDPKDLDVALHKILIYKKILSVR